LKGVWSLGFGILGCVDNMFVDQDDGMDGGGGDTQGKRTILADSENDEWLRGYGSLVTIDGRVQINRYK